ncbi:MAG: cytochrome b/b6 domain-containing protein [Alphaproteobacteria bacterium]|nr:cytochrome b/b6 domain-containing protein [Alphaproteobacteria bacterium]
MPEVIQRHSATTRVTHWINAAAVILLLMSGLNILNAHPRLYWGEAGSVHTAAWLVLSPIPDWATLPSTRDLATARGWHLFFIWVLVANGLLYLVWNLASGHVRRDLLPTRQELSPAHIAHEIAEHARLRWATGEADKRYNVLQKATYLAVIFVIAPLLVLTGLCMSPGFNAIAPWLVDLFGGRQSARSLHFLAAGGMAAFIAIHVALVLLAGPWNLLRSMVTGRYTVRQETAA